MFSASNITTVYTYNVVKAILLIPEEDYKYLLPMCRDIIMLFLLKSKFNLKCEKCYKSGNYSVPMYRQRPKCQPRRRGEGLMLTRDKGLVPNVDL